MNQQERVRAEVSAAYTRAVTGHGGCCGGGESGNQPKGVTARLAGYTDADTAALPADAVVNSFGCGNPLAFGAVKEGDVVLDLGSGAGIDLLIAAGKVGPAGKVIGVDMTDAMIERARANAAAAGFTNIEIRKGLIEDLPVESASVDWVISNCVINLSPEKHRVFAEIARVLKPGGQILVSDIVVEDLPEWARRNAALYASCVAGAIPERDYIAGLQAAGLADVTVRDRLIYDASQIAALIESDQPEAAHGSCCGGGSAVKGVIATAAAALAGKVQSLRVCARKPAA